MGGPGSGRKKGGGGKSHKASMDPLAVRKRAAMALRAKEKRANFINNMRVHGIGK